MARREPGVVPPRPTTAVTWKALLDQVRRGERQEWLLGVGGGPAVVRLLATWPVVERMVPRPRWLEEQWTAETDPVLRWLWLWDGRFPDGLPWRQWADLAGVVLRYRRGMMEQLRALQVIYPDGTISTIARQLVADRVLEQLPLAQQLAKRAT